MPLRNRSCKVHRGIPARRFEVKPMLKAEPISSHQYVVVSPIRNEEQYLPLTIASMCAQTVKPWKWVLVNDGSSDRTGALMDEATSLHPWIVALHRK